MPNQKTRFEVFKRDSFTCQYCGRSAPDVVLQTDHIDPKSNGGEDDILNLITSCFDCNSGKSNRLLSDHATVIKRKQQLDQLQERREQLEMMMEWHKELLNFDEMVVTELVDFWIQLTPGFTLNDIGVENLKRYVKRFGLNEVIEAMKISTSQYLKYDAESDDLSIPIGETVGKAFQYIPKICASRKKTEGKPYLQRMYYIRGILRNRLSYVNEWQSIQLMEKAYLNGLQVELMEELAKEVKNWTEFREALEGWLSKRQEPNDG